MNLLYRSRLIKTLQNYKRAENNISEQKRRQSRTKEDISTTHRAKIPNKMMLNTLILTSIISCFHTTLQSGQQSCLYDSPYLYTTRCRISYTQCYDQNLTKTLFNVFRCQHNTDPQTNTYQDYLIYACGYECCHYSYGELLTSESLRQCIEIDEKMVADALPYVYIVFGVLGALLVCYLLFRWMRKQDRMRAPLLANDDDYPRNG